MNKILFFLILIFTTAGVTADELTRTYTVKRVTPFDIVDEHLTTLSKEDVLKLARIDAGKLYLNTNKLKDDKFSSQLEVVSSAYIRINYLESSIKIIAGVTYQQEVATVFINDDFLEYQLIALEQVSHLTGKVEMALERLRLQKFNVDKKSMSLTLNNIRLAESELMNYQEQLKVTLDTKSWLKKENKGYVINTLKYNYSLKEKLLAYQLSELWCERAITTIILPLKSNMKVSIKSARMFRYPLQGNQNIYNYSGDKTLGGFAKYTNAGTRINNKAPNLDVLFDVSFDRDLLLQFSEWFDISQDDKLTIVYTDNLIENLAKKILLAKFIKIPFESVIKINNKSIAIISTSLNGKTKITKGFEDSYHVMSVPFFITEGVKLTHVSSIRRTNSFILHSVVNWNELSNKSSLASIKLTYDNLVWLL